MMDVVRSGYPKQGGGRRRFVALCGALAALAFACPVAGAQLPDLANADAVPLPDGAVGELLPGDAVEQTLNEPLPQVVEDVVSGSPVAPVREEVRRLAGGGTGGGSGGEEPPGGGETPGGGEAPGGGDTSASPSAGAAQPGAAPEPAGEGGSSPGEATRGTSRGTARERRARPRTAEPSAGRGARLDGAAGTSAGRAAGSRRDTSGAPSAPAEDGRNPLARTIEKIVKVVPNVVWLALGALLLVAVALGARAFVERRRSRALEAERERLLREVGLLERALLPEVPAQLGALATSIAYRPCEGPAAGGDFYDAFELQGGRVAVLVGDVSGHGPDALDQTNSIRAGLSACLAAGLSPRAALESVGRRAPAESSARLITVVVAVHDPATGTLTYATAGHPPPVLVGPCAYEPLTVASSPPIGVGFRTGLRETTVPLPSGSVACLFTDGLLEARTAGGMIGYERLTAMVAELGPDEQAEALLDRVLAEADETPDDMAVCLIRPLSGAEVLAPRIEVLELDPDDRDRGVAERFLEACELPPHEAVTALEQVHATAAGGGAVIEVTIDDHGALARVMADPRLLHPDPQPIDL